MLVRKLKEEWKPSENKYLKVGETIEITDAEVLIKLGVVEKVDLEVKVEPIGVDIELLDKIVCSKCGREFKTTANLKTHERFCKGVL